MSRLRLMARSLREGAPCATRRTNNVKERVRWGHGTHWARYAPDPPMFYTIPCGVGFHRFKAHNAKKLGLGENSLVPVGVPVVPVGQALVGRCGHLMPPL